MALSSAYQSGVGAGERNPPRDVIAAVPAGRRTAGATKNATLALALVGVAGDPMPGYGGLLAGGELTALVDYLRSLRG
ncbi:MAG TPA: hypothetical protein VHH90_08965 [Polyangia bacterium]|nr:hypothetical protein [Polyangia bacterium]